MNSTTMSVVEPPHDPAQQGDSRSKNLQEMIEYAPNLRFFGEVAVAFILFFQALYIRLAWDFPPAITLIPLLLYSSFRTWAALYHFLGATVQLDRDEHSQSLVNWGMLTVYQVR